MTESGILPADELLHIGLGPIPGHDTTELNLEDSEVCFTCGRRNIYPVLR